MANQKRGDSHVTYTRNNDRGSTLTSALRKGALYQACAVDRRALTLSMCNPPQQLPGPAVGQQTARVFSFSFFTVLVFFLFPCSTVYILNWAPYFLDLCNFVLPLCPTRRVCKCGWACPGVNLVLKVNLVCGPLGQKSKVMGLLEVEGHGGGQPT